MLNDQHAAGKMCWGLGAQGSNTEMLIQHESTLLTFTE